METLLENKIGEEKKPSLLRQIVDEADMMDEEGKANLLRKIKDEKAIAKAKLAAASMEGKWKSLSEEEIWEMVSSNRKKWYEESLNH